MITVGCIAVVVGLFAALINANRVFFLAFLLA